MVFRTRWILSAVFAAPLVLAPPLAVAQTAVELELSLVIDVSASVSTTEYNLQRTGYANAFLDPTVQAAIASYAAAGGIAVNVIQFSSNAVQVIPWTQLTSVAEANAFSGLLAGMSRSVSVGSSTDVEDGMSLGITGITGNTFNGTRKVVDVSGDGIQNTDPGCSESSPYSTACIAVQAQRDIAVGLGIRINGLPIEGDYGASGLTTWYNTNVKTPDGFIVTATSFATFQDAVIQKIGAEIVNTPVPEPATMALMGVGLLGLGAIRRRRRD